MIPQGFDALGPEAPLAARVVFEQRHRHPPQPRQVLGAVLGPRPTTVLAEQDIQHPMTIVLDAPMVTNYLGVIRHAPVKAANIIPRLQTGFARYRALVDREAE